jgi:hypothetical protein
MLPLFDPLNPMALSEQSDRGDSSAEPRGWKTKVVYANGKDGKCAFQLRPPVSVFTFLRYSLRGEDCRIRVVKMTAQKK